MLGLVVDVADEDQVRGMVDTVVRDMGGLDIAYNNVGIHTPVLPAADLETRDFDRVIAVNFTGLLPLYEV